MYNKRFFIPQIITSLRIINVVIFWFLFFNDLILESFILFHISYLTDIFDGICARRLNVISTFGAYFDAVADFIFIFVTFTAFILKDIYPFWILIIIGFWFLQFIVTSSRKEQIYDPIGKYSGLFLYITIQLYVPKHTSS